MNSYNKLLVSCLLATALLMNPLSAFAEHLSPERRDPLEPGAIVADLVLVRPLSLVATIAGSAFFIVSVPFAALGGNADETWESLVVTPATYTFKRPLGRFETSP